MPANLTPQYLEAEAEYKKAKKPEERLDGLKKMWILLPKHKGTEKIQAQLKTTMREIREEAETKKAGKKAGVSYKIPRQGAGQYVLLGAPNAGKSRLLTRLTRATPEVAPYPFTTREPHVGMTDWEDVKIQLVDLPPITADVMEGWQSSMARSADAAILMLDLADDDGPFAAETVIERLKESKSYLVGNHEANEEDISIQWVRTLLVANKSDDPGANDRLEIVREMFGDKFPIHVVAAEHGTGMEELRNELFRFLHIIRVYTKQPGKPPDMTSPFTCPEGSTVQEMAALVHNDFADKLKSARVWGTGVFEGQSVKRDHILYDKDVVELHI
ncbi:MAG: 50S ribosome-binding GTPase [Gemmataceae bacterium]|nr:50S ribosome-binding GTPase [Gemmataceae bacterium]